MTLHRGYALGRHESLEELDMGVGSVLSLKVTNELTFQVGDERGVLEPGALVWFPRRVPHAVANLSREPCRFITVVTPSGIEDFFRALRDYPTGSTRPGPFDSTAFDEVLGSDTRPVVGPPLS